MKYSKKKETSKLKCLVDEVMEDGYVYTKKPGKQKQTHTHTKKKNNHKQTRIQGSPPKIGNSGT